MEENVKELIKKKQIKTEIITVKDNILKLGSETIQIKNISQISVVKPPLQFSVKAIVFFVIGFILFTIVRPLGLIVMLISAGILGYQFYQFKTGGQYLVLNQNSGRSYCINFKDSEFLEEVRDVLEDCINQSLSNVTINTGSQRIIKGPVTYQNNQNVGGVQHVHNQDSFHTNSHNTTNDDHSTHTFKANDIHSSTISMEGVSENKGQQKSVINWEQLSHGLQNAVNFLPVDSEGYEASQQALAAVKEKNESKLSSVIKKYSKTFASDVFINATGNMVSQMLLSLIGL